MIKKIAIIGGGGHAKVVASIILKLSEYEIIGYADTKDMGKLLGFPYLGTDDSFISKYRNKIEFVALGVGQIETCEIRKCIVKKYEDANFKFPSVVSPTAIINRNVKIGKGTVIMDGVVINVDTKIGEYSIVNTNSTIEHDCKIGDFVHIAPGVTMSGNVTIGNNCMIGVGSIIIQGIKIIANTFVGAGSVVTKNIEIIGKYVGIPSRRVKDL